MPIQPEWVGRRLEPRPRALLITGPAGSGKSTLGAGLAVRTGAALVDEDVLTNPLVAVVAELAGGSDDIDHARLRERVRTARYTALFDVVAAQLACGLSVVAVAPFTAETSAASAWSGLTQRLRSAGAERVELVWLDCPEQELLRRLRFRGAARDRAKVVDEAASARFLTGLHPPVVPALRVDATRPSEWQIDAVLSALD